MLANLLPERRAITDIPGGGRWSLDPMSVVGSPQLKAMANVAGYACVRLIADTVSSLPIDFYRSRGGVQEQIDPPAWYEMPDAMELRASWLFRGVSSLALQNRAHLMVTARDRQQVATSARWLSPTHVRPQSPGSLQLVDMAGRPLPMADVSTASGFMLAGADESLSPVDTFRRFFRMGDASEEFGARWFEDGAHPTGVLSTDKPMTGAQADETIEAFAAKQGKRRRPVLLSGGMKWQAAQSSAVDSQFLETQKWVVDQAARIWGVPASTIGGSEGGGLTYNTVEGAAIRLATFTLRPTFVRLEQLLSYAMLPRGQWCQFNPDALFRTSLKDRYEAHHIALAAGFKTPDEVRALEDLPPLPNGSGASARPVQTIVDRGGPA